LHQSRLGHPPGGSIPGDLHPNRCYSIPGGEKAKYYLPKQAIGRTMMAKQISEIFEKSRWSFKGK